MAVQGEIKDRIKTNLREPGRFDVIMHNDDYTPMDFVVLVLIEIFKKEQQEAVRLMLMVHEGGRAVVGTFSYDIAKTKVKTVTSLARQEGYPFCLTIEEAKN